MAGTRTMQAVGFSEYGGPEVVGLVELPVPEPGPGQVRVRVQATVVNPADVQFRRGDHAAFVPDAVPPHCGGLEFVGRVDAVGEGADPAVGALVAGTSHFIPDGRGAHAEYVVTDARAVAACPAGADPVALATVPMNGLTARVTVDSLGLAPGSTVVVTGAAGAVGGYVTELAADAGLRVVAVASASDEDELRALGAAEFFTRGDDALDRILEKHPDGVAAVVDAAMLDAEAMSLVADGGQFITLRPGHVPEPERGVEPRLVSFRRYQDRPEVLNDLLERATSGGLTPRVSRTFGADRGAEAFVSAETPGLRGRVVLTFEG